MDPDTDENSIRCDSKGSRIIGRILPPAVGLWLRSQAEKIGSLSLDLAGRDREIISGYLPRVTVSAQQVIYKGIHIGQLHLSAQDIRINIGQVIRGKPLRLMKGFPVLGSVILTVEDLNASLASPLLASGLRDFWRSLVQQPLVAQSVCDRYGALPCHPKMTLHNPELRLGQQRIALSFYPQVLAANEKLQTLQNPIILDTALSVVSGSQLKILSPRWLEHLEDMDDAAKGEPIEALQGYRWDLGKDTQLSQLSLESQQLLCNGQITVNP